ncbi:MAG TPA: RidA family protein [Gammaproteobacteria bacterium]|nr:RidA family protein [Gammaproteobacteria bacterium]HIK69738.1 RidA family protein [Pseudomonadales bacterium]
MKVLLMILVVFLSSSVFAEVQYLTSENTLKAGLPFSDAVKAGNFIFLSGQVGTDPSSDKLVTGGIEAETHQIFRNIQAILSAQGASLKNIIKCTVMIDDISQWPAFNQVYVSYFPGDKPARSAFGADGLALGASLELECWAYQE